MRSFDKRQNSNRGRFFLAALLISLVYSQFYNMHSIFSPLPCQAQSQLRERLRQKIHDRQSSDRRQSSGIHSTIYKLAGLNVAVWMPMGTGPFPLVVFSHGYHGRYTQSEFLMEAMARAGYLVVAPNHKDAVTLAAAAAKPSLSPAKDSFLQPLKWSDETYRGRGEDIARLICALHSDTAFDAKIDWERVALAGHSLGGYTVLGLAGAWPSWKLPAIKAVLALSPYSQPFLTTKNLSTLNVPVMYQGGTRDFGITPAVKKPGGAYDQTRSPAYYVEFEKMGHLGWSSMNQDHAKQDLIDQYCLAFSSTI